MVKLLAEAALENSKIEMFNQTMTQAVAVLHGLDVALNRGKGNVLDNFSKKLFKGSEKFLEERKEQQKEYFTDEAFSFFTNRFPRKNN